MPRWSHLRDWDERVSAMDEAALSAEIAYWRKRADHLGAKEARKSVAQRIRKLERLLHTRQESHA